MIVGLGFLLIAGVFAGAVVMALRGGARLELARVIGDAGGAIAKAPLLFAGFALVGAGLPNAALFVSLAATPGLLTTGAVLSTGLIGSLLAFAWYQFFLLAMIAATLEGLGGRPHFRGVIAAALPLVPQAMLTSVLYWVAVGIGFAFFVVPGIILACVWMLVLPVLVEERPSLFAAFARAAKLSRGVRWQLFLLAVLGFVFALVVQSMLGAMAALLGGQIAAQVGFALVSSLLAVLPPALVASAYRQIVILREGARTRELEEIFA
ncbi:hypothetical protein COC42_04995 [Sphingomonas spermidinifaciens]|uniref:Glycerophosphoryl diester phosphodiesterase membrane domain-containing protein n=1 Tax=Sphingomonas spermidinifaciens TaxID=1141889 RepID=A0A2A4B6K4_9SPHN|nr:hypothetical protein [Sphingomonas spermidinifaciens]PCD03710.1 hypothetical protein COC42_04995 [Sphingomonas spermidinifaciens]